MTFSQLMGIRPFGLVVEVCPESSGFLALK
jgi:hypothetical protein